ncbi:hypothetical protein ACFLXY_02615 [Chloroflexota bacterium]
MILEGYFAIELYTGFDILERYLKVTEESLLKAQNDFDTHVNEQLKRITQLDIPPEEKDAINEFYGEQHWDYSEVFPGILRNAFLVSAYSLMEHKMALICQWLKKDNDLIDDWSKSSGKNTLEKFKS